MKKYEFDLEKFDLDRVILLLEELHKILMENKGINLTSGVRNILAILCDEKYSLRERTDDARSSYRHILGGMGTLGDYMIGDIVLDNHLTNIMGEIWDQLDCSLSFLPDVER